MLKLHAKKRKNKITISEKEFLKLLKNYESQQFEPIEIVYEDEDLQTLTKEELKIRAAALKDLKNGHTIKFRDVKDKWLQGKNANL